MSSISLLDAMNKEEYIYPTKRAQITGAACLLFFITIYLVISPLTDLLTNNLEQTKDIDTFKAYLITANIAALSLFLFIFIWLLIIGTRIIKNNHFPPIGYPVIVRTKIKNGNSAIAQGILCYLVSSLMLFSSCFFAYLAWLSYGI